MVRNRRNALPHTPLVNVKRFAPSPRRARFASNPVRVYIVWMIRARRPFIYLAVVVATVFPNVALSGPASASAVPQCSYDQINVATTWGTGGLAGKYGVPFLLVNVSHSSCYLEGYAKLDFSVPTRHHIAINRGPSGAYAYVKPRRVVIAPGRIATFGVTIGDASNQSNHHIAACTVSAVYTDLPVRGFRENYENDMAFNICLRRLPGWPHGD